jgi:hypothetical protein
MRIRDRSRNVFKERIQSPRRAKRRRAPDQGRARLQDRPIVKQRRLKQAEAAGLLGIKQPNVSKMLRGDFRPFSIERLLRFLVALDQDVKIVVKPHRDSKWAPALPVS